MASSLKREDLITSASSRVGVVHTNRIVRRDTDPRRSQPGGLSEVVALSRYDRPHVVSSKRPPRILVVDSALGLGKLHLVFLRSIPAIVETVASCADMYLHQERAYALVILVLDPRAKETAEAAHFVRRRWSAARILLLERESAVIDDWLYDERVDPNLNPATVCETVIRLMTGQEHWIPG